MNYEKCYYNIISIAKTNNRSKKIGDVYYESHHIKPRALGGLNKHIIHPFQNKKHKQSSIDLLKETKRKNAIPCLTCNTQPMAISNYNRWHKKCEVKNVT